jgi:ABC-2 type transport system permease protein
MIGTQVFLNARTNIFAGAVEHPENLAAIAFALAAYTLMLSAFQTLNAEGQALWILYAVPRPLESVLWQKTKLWTAMAIIYPLIIFAVAVGVAGHISRALAGAAAVVLLGVPIFAVIATALGVFACDPLAQEVHRRVRLTYTYLYMVLASLYAYAVYASTIWQRAAMVVLTALLAVALWQKARDRFDYLLDPSASPPSRVSVSDGLIAALMFLRAAGACRGLLSAWRQQLSGGNHHLDRLLRSRGGHLRYGAVGLLANADDGRSPCGRPRFAAGVDAGRRWRRCRLARRHGLY